MSRRPVVEGLYDQIIDEDDNAQINGLREAAWVISTDKPDTGQLPYALAVQLLPQVVAALASVGDKDTRSENQIQLANAVLRLLREANPEAGIRVSDAFTQPVQRLLSAVPPNQTLGSTTAPIRPSIPLNSSDLLVNGHREPRIGSEIRRELPSSDRVDLLCAFLRFSGVRVVLDGLKEFLQRRPGALRVLTTSYMGATDRRAI